MFATIWAFLAGNARVLAISAGLIFAAYFGGQHVGAVHEREHQQAALARVEAASQKLQRAADRVASAALMRAEAAVTTERKEVDDALSSIPDQAPTDRQHTRACIELRRQAAAGGQSQPAC